jgi:hypothetical protein
MLLSYTSGDTVVVAAGGFSITVGMSELGEPVTVGLAEEKLEERPVVTGNPVDVAEPGVVKVAVELDKKPEVEEARPDPVPNIGAEGIIELAVVEGVEVEELSVADRLEFSIEADERDDDTSLMGVTTGRPVGDAIRGKVTAL